MYGVAHETVLMEKHPRVVVAVWVALAALACYVAMFQGLNAVGLAGPDEPRYASVARSMATSGDWITPRLNGEPWFEKPALYYWLAAVCYRVVGNHEAAARLPSAIAALIATMATGWIARRLFGLASGLVAVLLLPTSIAMIGFARAATPDMVFAAAITVAMVAAATSVFVETDHGRTGRHVTLGAALGLAVLAKGPAGVVLVVGSLVLWAWAAGRWRSVAALVMTVPVVTAFAGVALPWYVLCTWRNPEFFNEFIVSHNFERFTTPVFGHQQPLWFFVPVILIGAVPWTPVLFASLYEILSRGQDVAATPEAFFISWVLFPLLFFTLSRSKLPGYVLPAIPPLVVVLAATLAEATVPESGSSPVPLMAVGGALATIGAVLVFPPPLASDLPAAAAALALLSGLILAGGGLLVLLLAWKRLLPTAFVAAITTMIVFLWQFNSSVVPRLEGDISARPAAVELRALGGEQRAVAYQLDRAKRYGLEYYLGRGLAEWAPGRPPHALVLTTPTGVFDLQARGISVNTLATVRGVSIVALRKPR